MKRFLIRYKDPETGLCAQRECEFADTHEPHFISARAWAEDLAYTLADKGSFTLREI